MSIRRHALTCVLACAAAVAAPAARQSQPPQPAAQPPAAAKPAPALNDLDTFMAKVLEKRNENWRTLHDYILSERERFDVLGPLGIPLHGLHREFHWFVRDGYLVRSPVKSNGVALSADERKKYEDRWLEEEKERERKAEKAREKDAKAGDEPRKMELSVSASGNVEFSGLAGPGAEPRFISEAYFMKFKFEPGNYYFAGREQLDGREVLKIEYLPSNLFDDSKRSDTSKAPPKAGEEPAPGGAGKDGQKRDRKAREERDMEDKIERAMNKTSTVTMWIDPQEYQIVRFAFDNVDWGFLPGRQIARVDEARASMTMGRVFDGIWLPKDVTFKGAVTFAPGTIRFTYSREFFDYRRGEVSAKIRGYVAKEPQS